MPIEKLNINWPTVGSAVVPIRIHPIRIPEVFVYNYTPRFALLG